MLGLEPVSTATHCKDAGYPHLASCLTIGLALRRANKRYFAPALDSNQSVIHSPTQSCIDRTLAAIEHALPRSSNASRSSGMMLRGSQINLNIVKSARRISGVIEYYLVSQRDFCARSDFTRYFIARFRRLLVAAR
jgi:hypothetical protein